MGLQDFGAEAIVIAKVLEIGGFGVGLEHFGVGKRIIAAGNLL